MSESIQLPVGSTDAAPALSQTEQAAKTQKEQQTPQRPENVPEKFWKDGAVDQDALLKSYSGLEKQNSTKKPDPKPDPKAEGEKEGKEGEKKDKPKEGEAKTDAVDPQAEFTKEFADTGTLSDESVAKAAKQFGVSPDTVKAYLAGLKAQSEAGAEAGRKAAYEATVGEENYAAMATWARDNLNEAESNAYNEALATGDSAKIDLAVSGLYQKYTQAEGRPAGTRIRGAKNTGNVTSFRSTAEVTDAMNDPRYQSDPAYREEVAQRIAVSDVL